MFRPPLHISKKRPDVVPAIGEYDQSINTIQADLKKRKERSVRISTASEPRIENPLQSNLKLNRQLNKSANDRLPMGKADDHEKYLGPGCYDMPREFDKPNMESKGSVLISKVLLPTLAPCCRNKDSERSHVQDQAPDTMRPRRTTCGENAPTTCSSTTNNEKILRIPLRCGVTKGTTLFCVACYLI